MLRKLQILLRRIKTMSFKKMFLMINQIHNEYGKAKIITFIDMIWCALKYSVGYLDYRVFGFADTHGKDRKTFLTMNDNLALVRKVNNPEYFNLFNNKVLFLERFGKYIGRDWLDLEDKSVKALENFCQGKSQIFAKQKESFGGQGISQVHITQETDFEMLFNELIQKKQFLIENKIIQHEKMNELYPDSVNTLRIVTLVKDGKANIVCSLIRMGQNGSCLDNITSGGMYAPINENGIVSHPAFCDKEGLCHEFHPTSKTKIVGFEIPFFKEAAELVKEVALIEPNMKYIGWDVAITPTGPILVEGNNFPCYEIMQNYKHRDRKEGLKPKFEEILGMRL